MTFHLVTIFPEFFDGFFAHGVLSKAIQAGLIAVKIHNLRDWTSDRHKTVDDRPFGGGEGMLLKPEPLFAAVETILPARTEAQRVILTSAQGSLFTQAKARQLVAYEDVLFICGRYEGVDERVAEHLADEELSIGDFVLSGGELASAVMIDSIVRLIPGVLGNQASTVHESFTEGLLDCPQWTRPAEFRGWPVPEILLNGHHEQIRKWRRQAALEKTQRKRSDLLPPEA